MIAAGLLAVAALASLPVGDRSARAPAATAADAPLADAEAGGAAAAVVAPPALAAASTPALRVGATPSAAAPGAPSAPGPLPPLDAPLAEVRAELEQRARAGDARAACRLAADLSRCAGVERRQRFRDTVDPTRQHSDGARIAEGELEWRVDTTARLEEQLAADRRVCAGIGPEDTRQALPWLYQAAVLGSVPAMSRFAGADWWWSGAAVHHPELVARYAGEAPRMAEAAIAAGDPTLLFRLGLTLSERSAWAGYGPLGEVMTPDPVRARALLRTAMQLVNQPDAPLERPGRRTLRSAERILAELEASLDAAEIAESERQSAALRAAVVARSAKRPTARRPERPIGEFVAAPDCAD